MRISQPTIAFFAAVNQLILTDLLGNKTLLYGFKRSWFVICGFRSVLCVSLFQGSLLVIVIMIDGSDKHNCEGGFWTLEFACLWKAQESLRAVSEALGSGGINGQLTACFTILLVFIHYNTIFLSSVNQLSLSYFMLVERQQFLEFPVTSN